MALKSGTPEPVRVFLSVSWWLADFDWQIEDYGVTKVARTRTRNSAELVLVAMPNGKWYRL